MNGAVASPTSPRPSPSHLADGTPFHGQVGVLARDPDEDRVQCHLCGEWFRSVGGSHLRTTHGWTLDAYRNAFHLPATLPCCSHGVSDRQRVLAHRQMDNGTGFGVGRDGGVPVEGRSPGIPQWRSLASARPDLLPQLHPERNHDLDTPVIGAGSPRKVWWCCEACGHAWQATVGSRANGHGCPACYKERRTGPRATPPGRSLAALHPRLIAEWDRARNASLDPSAITPGSHERVWWECGRCGHGWRASIQNRVSGHACPVCGVTRRAELRSRVTYERSLAAQHPELVTELAIDRDPRVDPAKLGARSSQQVWWACRKCGHQWRTAVSTRTNGSGCPVCGIAQRARTQRHVEPARTLSVKHPQIAAELHPTLNPGTDLDGLAARSSLKLWWQCAACGHDWETRVSTRTRGSGCPECYRASRTSSR